MLDIRKGSAPFNTTMFFNMAVGCAVLCFAMAAPAQKNAKKISPDLLVRESGVHEECVNGRVHSLTYNTYGVSSNAFVDLDSIDDIDHVECDLDNTKLKLHFRNDVLAAEWLVRFHDFNTHFLVGGAKWNCTVLQENRPALIVRRVVGADMPDVPSRYIDVSASLAHYDEIYSDADISFATNGACNEEEFNADKKVCVGYNSACTGAATNSLPIFSNKFVTLACSDCFIDFEMDIFFELHIRGFQVSNLSTGFRDVSVNGSAIVTAQAQANWNTGIDKTLPLIQTTYLVDFKVGVVPFMVFFALPVELTGSFTFQSEADVSFGANLKWGFGTAAVSWDPVNHWTHSKPTPVLAFEPVFNSHASLDAEATFSLVPSLQAHFDRVLSYTLTATPTLDLSLKGSEDAKQICLDGTYDLSVKADTLLDINIPWANIAKDYTWTKDVYESGSKLFVQKCIPL